MNEPTREAKQPDQPENGGTDAPTKDKARCLPIHSMADLQKMRTSYGLSHPNLVQMLGVSKTTMAKWERGMSTPDTANRQKIKRLGDILQGLGRVMKKHFIAPWLTSPNHACEGRTPMNFLGEGDYETIEDIVYFLEAGEPV